MGATHYGKSFAVAGDCPHRYFDADKISTTLVKNWITVNGLKVLIVLAAYCKSGRSGLRAAVGAVTDGRYSDRAEKKRRLV